MSWNPRPPLTRRERRALREAHRRQRFARFAQPLFVVACLVGIAALFVLAAVAS